MSQTSAELLIIILNAVGAGILMMVAGVIQKIMDTMDTAEFKKFLNALDKTAMSDPFAVTVATLPIIVAIPYFYFFGFNHYWFIAGYIVWAIGSTITKIINLPIYIWVRNPKNTDPEALKEQRNKLRLGNNLRAWTTLASVALMLMQFGIQETIISAIILIILASPITWFSRRYYKNQLTRGK
jgi:accessory gene regulator protein AgrB